jgi:RNA polymerase sigma-70 factor (ECF subfamily)
VREKLVELLPSLYRYLYRLSGETHLAEDLAQDVILRAMRCIDQLDSEEALRVWLFRIGANAWVDCCRRAGRKRSFENERRSQVADSLLVSSEPEPSEILGQREQLQWTQRAIMRLPERQRMVLILVVCEELSHREVAEVLGISTDAVKASLSVARVTMRKMLKQEEVKND